MQPSMYTYNTILSALRFALAAKYCFVRAEVTTGTLTQVYL